MYIYIRIKIYNYIDMYSHLEFPKPLLVLVYPQRFAAIPSNIRDNGNSHITLEAKPLAGKLGIIKNI